MFKKIVLSMLAAILIAVSFNGTALAAEDDHPEIINARGEVIAVDSGQENSGLKPVMERLSPFLLMKTHISREKLKV